MDTQEILSKIKQQDKQAFRRLIIEYGKGLYLKLYSESGDPDAARQATKAAFTELYMALNSQQSPDIIESLLYSIGERRQREILQAQTMKLAGEYLEEVKDLTALKETKAEDADAAEPVCHGKAVSDMPLAAEPAKAEKKGVGFWQVVLVLLIAAGLWAAAGALMGAGHLPKYDLGYSWFNVNIADWFTWL